MTRDLNPSVRWLVATIFCGCGEELSAANFDFQNDCRFNLCRSMTNTLLYMPRDGRSSGVVGSSTAVLSFEELNGTIAKLWSHCYHVYAYEVLHCNSTSIFRARRNTAQSKWNKMCIKSVTKNDCKFFTIHHNHNTDYLASGGTAALYISSILEARGFLNVPLIVADCLSLFGLICFLPLETSHIIL